MAVQDFVDSTMMLGIGNLILLVMAVVLSILLILTVIWQPERDLVPRRDFIIWRASMVLTVVLIVVIMAVFVLLNTAELASLFASFFGGAY